MTDIRKALNVFSQGVVAGQLAMISASGPASLAVQLISTSSDTILPAYPVKLITGTGVIPQVELAIPGTDSIYGFVLSNPKQSSWVAEEVFQITTKFSILHMTSSGILARGAQVGMDPTSYKLIAATTTNYIGTLIDEATADKIVRVDIAVPLTVAP